VSEREERLGLNEALFREVNERIEALGEQFGLEVLDLVCECASYDCTQRIALTIGDYEELRSNPRRFAVATGHVIPEVERIVEQRRGYDVVEKDEGDPAEVAEETDPRSD
jgi:hypothetical protein